LSAGEVGSLPGDGAPDGRDKAKATALPNVRDAPLAATDPAPKDDIRGSGPTAINDPALTSMQS